MFEQTPSRWYVASRLGVTLNLTPRQTDFEKKQEDVIVKQLSDPTFANVSLYCVKH